MRRLILLMAPGLVALCSLSAQVRDGFDDVPWGTSFDVMNVRFALGHVQPGKCQGQYLTNVTNIGGAEIGECDFEFTTGRFSGVIITTRGEWNSHALLAYLRTLYGGGKRETSHAYQWLSGDTHTSYDEDSTGNAYVYLYSLSLQREQEGFPPR